MLWLLTTMMNNQYRSIMVVVRLKHHSALVIIIFGVNICGLSYTKLKQKPRKSFFIIWIRIAQKNKINDKKEKKEIERESSNSLPQECSDVFCLHMCKERTHESLSRSFFLFSFLFLSFPPPIRSFDLSKGLVRWSHFFFFLLFLSLCCFLFVRARQRR